MTLREQIAALQKRVEELERFVCTCAPHHMNLSCKIHGLQHPYEISGTKLDKSS